MSEPDRGLRSFLSELKHRKVFRVAGLYAVVAFVLWQANLGVGAGASLEKDGRPVGFGGLVRTFAFEV